ncbi:MAG: hypothetical protein FWG30_07575 [Eubacteriaceae bacterium]|nr:hypothetical protein [Eubacteriaceae bacterium]
MSLIASNTQQPNERHKLKPSQHSSLHFLGSSHIAGSQSSGVVVLGGHGGHGGHAGWHTGTTWIAIGIEHVSGGAGVGAGGAGAGGQQALHVHAGGAATTGVQALHVHAAGFGAAHVALHEHLHFLLTLQLLHISNPPYKPQLYLRVSYLSVLSFYKPLVHITALLIKDGSQYTMVLSSECDDVLSCYESFLREKKSALWRMPKSMVGKKGKR